MSTSNSTLKLKALEPDTFSGEMHKVDMWLYSVEQFFLTQDLDYNNADTSKCAAITGALLRGNALQWHRRLSMASTLPTTYPLLKQKLLAQFGAIDDTRKARDALMQLTQKSSVNQYISLFESIVAHIDNINEHEQIHKFVYGLKTHIRTQVLLLNPTTLNEAMQYALSAEDIRTNTNLSQYLGRERYNGATGDESIPMELGALRGGNTNNNYRPNNNRQAQRYRRGQNRGGRGFNNSYQQRQVQQQGPRCFNCNKYGHFAKNCPDKRRQRQVNQVSTQVSQGNQQNNQPNNSTAQQQNVHPLN